MEILNHDQKCTGTADHVLPKYFGSPPGGFVWNAYPGPARLLMIASPLIVIPAATASSRASFTGRPELLVPSPDTSMTRRRIPRGRLAIAEPRNRSPRQSRCGQQMSAAPT